MSRETGRYVGFGIRRPSRGLGLRRGGGGAEARTERARRAGRTGSSIVCEFGSTSEGRTMPNALAAARSSGKHTERHIRVAYRRARAWSRARNTRGDKRTPHAAQPPTPRTRLARGAPPEEDGAMLARRLEQCREPTATSAKKSARAALKALPRRLAAFIIEHLGPPEARESPERPARVGRREGEPRVPPSFAAPSVPVR